MPIWWNGIHEGLKIPSSSGGAGSSPAMGTLRWAASSPAFVKLGWKPSMATYCLMHPWGQKFSAIREKLAQGPWCNGNTADF